VSIRTARQRVIAAVYDKRGRLLAEEENSYSKTHRLQAHFASLSGNAERIYLHAELAALIKASKRGIPHKLVIERYGAQGAPLCAKPCKGCQLAIKAFNVKRVVHT